MAETYTLIETVPLDGSTSVATFLTVPGSYTDLIIEGHIQVAISSGSCDLLLRFNNDSGGNYYGQGASSNAVPQFRSDRYTAGTGARLTGTVNSQSQSNPIMFNAQINEYSNGSFTKNGVQNWSYLVNTGTPIANVGFGSFQWRNTNAITRVDILATNSGALTGRVSLYGILAGNA